MAAKVDYVNITFKTGCSTAVRILLPISLRDMFDNGVCVYENPLRLQVPALFSGRKYIAYKLNGGSRMINYTPFCHIDEILGKYSYEIDDMTVYLEKIN